GGQVRTRARSAGQNSRFAETLEAFITGISIDAIDIPRVAFTIAIPFRIPECESGGTGRRAGFRSQWLTAVGVRVPPFAPTPSPPSNSSFELHHSSFRSR